MLLFQTSRDIIFYFQHFIQVCFYFLGKKTGGARAPPAPPLATALYFPGAEGCGLQLTTVLEKNKSPYFKL